jgi:hypothetical protein
MMAVIAIALVLGMSVYLTGKSLFNNWLTNSYNSQEEKAARYESYIDNLQEYVTRNDVSSTDTKDITRWMNNNRNVYLFLYKDGQLFFDGSMEELPDKGGNNSETADPEKPSGEGWKSGIENPLYKKGEGEPYVRTVTLKNDSLVTSGTYIRNYEVDGKIYHHIIDPVTLAPENRYLSLTVQTAHSGIADALSTAIFNMDLSEAEAFVSELEGVEVTLVFNDGSHKVLP